VTGLPSVSVAVFGKGPGGTVDETLARVAEEAGGRAADHTLVARADPSASVATTARTQ
jgi:hypothetical protein